MNYVLIATIIHAAIGAVDTQQIGHYDTYADCETDGFARVESLRPLYPGAQIKWDCHRE